ncbi:MAG: FtsQ-type POTRA domain-containing protein [Oscillospiraceae bacterium]|jgi:cell division septal protein FtsQ|nr:FtsQ-type POTRA domain-containing protein [Oscillospiraceae bacterium]
MDERRAASRGKKRGSGPIWRRIRYAAALIAVIAAVSTFFKISDIQVEGNVIYSDEEIISASGLDTGSMLFFAGRRGAGRRIYAKLPYVDKVKIRTRAPDTLVIAVEEAGVAASVGTEDGGWVLVSRSCKVLGFSDVPENIEVIGVTPDKPEAASILTAAEGESGKMSVLRELLAQLGERDMLGSVGRIDLTNSGDVRFDYQGRYTVKLGTADRLGYRLDFALNIIDELGPGEKGTIDLSTDTEGHYIPR